MKPSATLASSLPGRGARVSSMRQRCPTHLRGLQSINPFRGEVRERMYYFDYNSEKPITWFRVPCLLVVVALTPVLRHTPKTLCLEQRRLHTLSCSSVSSEYASCRRFCRAGNVAEASLFSPSNNGLVRDSMCSVTAVRCYRPFSALAVRRNSEIQMSGRVSHDFLCLRTPGRCGVISRQHVNIEDRQLGPLWPPTCRTLEGEGCCCRRWLPEEAVEPKD